MNIIAPRRRMVRRALLVAAAVTAMGLAGPATLTAHAATDNCGPNFQMTCVALATSAPNGTVNNEEIVESCTATGVDFAVATGVECYIVGDTDGVVRTGTTSTVWEPGTTATTAVVYNVPKDQSYKVCAAGGFVGLEGSFNPIQNPVCNG
jgi:hypothetical protein